MPTSERRRDPRLGPEGAELAGNVSTGAVVRNVFVGSDRVTRLDLHFENGAA